MKHDRAREIAERIAAKHLPDEIAERHVGEWAGALENDIASALLAERREALDQAARVADVEAMASDESRFISCAGVAAYIAAAIRALSGQPAALVQRAARNPTGPHTLPVAADDGWRDIESAPKTDASGIRTILITDGVCVPDLVSWRARRPERRDRLSGTIYKAVPEGWFCVNGSRSRLDGKATHWHPLPPPPTPPASEDTDA